MTRQWYLALETRPTPGYSYSGEKLRYVITDGRREHVMYAYPGSYFFAKIRVLWRNLTAVPSVQQVQEKIQMKELEARHKRLEMEAAVRQFEIEMAR